jgi:hypothetical protein
MGVLVEMGVEGGVVRLMRRGGPAPAFGKQAGSMLFLYTD